MRDLVDSVDQAAMKTKFSGVVRIDRGDDVVLARAYGFAHRAHSIANTLDTQFGIASGLKGLTALVVVSLIEDGVLDLGTTVRSVLGRDLPLIGDEVTVEHLLGHRSGIGDYLDEDESDDIADYAMPVPVHALVTTEDYVPILDGHTTKFPAGEQFAYCNGGFVVLALIAERAAGTPYHDLVEERVCAPAGMRDSAFLRSDELPGRAAVGYLEAEGVRSNILHLPVRGTGDGGIYSTAADIHSFWAALFGGRIVSKEWVAEMTRPRSDAPADSRRYGLGFWLHESRDIAMLVGYDAGVSFQTAHDPDEQLTYTVISNTSDGAWPIVTLLDEALIT